MQSVTRAGVWHRTRVLPLTQATRFARCLQANPRFAEVSVEESGRTKKADRYFVRFQPASSERQEALIQAQQDARADRAASQEFTFAFDRDGGFVWCLSHHSGEVYEVTPAECTCPDHHYRLRGTGIRCKHRLALEVAIKAGEVVHFPAGPTLEPTPAPVTLSAYGAARAESLGLSPEAYRAQCRRHRDELFD